MYVSRFKSMLLLSALCLAIAAPAVAGQAQGSFNVGVTIVNPQDPMPADAAKVRETQYKAGQDAYPGLENQTFDVDTFTYTVVNGRKTKEGYPVYAMECNFQGDRQCYGEAGQPLGTIEEVAKDITPVSNKDAIRPDWYCDRLCVNNQDIVVGAVSPTMQAWLKRNPGFKQKRTAAR